MSTQPLSRSVTIDPLWQAIRAETALEANKEPILASFLHATILNHDTLEAALSFHLAHKLDSPTASALLMREVIEQALQADPAIGEAIRSDVRAVRERDSACVGFSVPFLYFKGFHALQAWRVAHWLWQQGRESLRGRRPFDLLADLLKPNGLKVLVLITHQVDDGIDHGRHDGCHSCLSMNNSHTA